MCWEWVDLIHLTYEHSIVMYPAGSVTNKDVDSDWNLHLLASIATMKNYNHLEVSSTDLN
jgi:hypothetical protein